MSASLAIAPALGRIRRIPGIAGHYAYVVTVTHPGEASTTVHFHGSRYGGPVRMTTASGLDTFVSEPYRFGEILSPEWIRRFYA